MYDPCTDQVWVKYRYSMKQVCEREGEKASLSKTEAPSHLGPKRSLLDLL